MTAHSLLGQSGGDFLALQRRITELYQEDKGAIVRVKAAYDSRNPQETPQVNIGTGFFISKEGHVLTNASVALNPDRVWIVHDGIDYAATLIGHDTSTNLALLKVNVIPPNDFAFLPLGDSSSIPAPGTMVLRIGAPLELDPSPSFGLVSGFESRFGQHIFPCGLIRTTLAAGPGDGGAAYLDLNGRLIGIQVGSLVEIGSTYVLPARAIRRVRDDLLFNGEVKESWIGFEVTEDQSVSEGTRVLLRQVMPNTPAADAGMQVGDQLLSIGNYEIHSLDDLRNAMFYNRVGEYVSVKVQRDGKTQEFNVRLAERPASEAQPVGLLRPGPAAGPHPGPGTTPAQDGQPRPAARDAQPQPAADTPSGDSPAGTAQ